MDLKVTLKNTRKYEILRVVKRNKLHFHAFPLDIITRSLMHI